MIREVKKINRRSFVSTILISAILLFISSCSVLDPLRLTYDNDRQKIIEEILMRGRHYTIRKDDEDVLISLMNEPDPQIRLSVVKLMENNPSQKIYDALIAAILDDDETVSAEAERIVLDAWEDSYKAVIRGLNSPRSGIVYVSIDLIREKESRDESVYLLTLFSDERPTVRANASRVFVSLNEYEHPWFQQLLDSPVPVVRQTAVETLPRFGNPEIIPSLIRFILDPVPEIRTAAIFSISEFDRDALPALHETVRIAVRRELRLSVLELIDGIQEVDSIPVLVSLLDDEDPLIAAKSVEILFRQGPGSVPELLTQMLRMKEEGLILSFNLIKRFQDQSALPAVAEYFASEETRISSEAVDTVRSFGPDAFPFLIQMLEHKNPEIRRKSLLLLVEQRAPSLVYDSERGEYPVNRVFYFFETLPEEKIMNYLNEVELPGRIVSALNNLYEIELNTRQYQEIRSIRDRDKFPYLYFFREWEDALMTAELSRQGSFSYMHNYFDTGVEAWLQESKQLRETAKLFDRSALSFRDSAMRSGSRTSREEIQLVSRYLYNRKRLSENWRALTSDIQNLAMLIFLRYSLDIQAVVREYDYFRTLPDQSAPTPQNLQN